MHYPVNYFYGMYIIDASADIPIMLIDKHIGYDETDGMGIDGSEFAKELMYLDGLGKQSICIWICSPGGVVLDGYNIYNAMLRTKTKVDTLCMGMAASIAAVIFQAGRNRVMCDYGILMYHNPFGGDNEAGTEAVRNSIIKMISTRSQMPEPDVEKMMKRESFISADEALTLKLCDKVEPSADFNKKRLQPVANNASGYYRESRLILNTILNHSDMKKITNRLKLNESANEDSIVTAIDEIENKFTVQNGIREKAEAELVSLKEKMKNDKKAYDELKAELDGLKEKDKNKTELETEEKAKDMVTNFAKLGKIKNDEPTIKAWTAKAKVDIAGTKALLEGLPLNKTSMNIVNKVTETVTEENKNLISMENSVAQDMLRIKNLHDKRHSRY